MSHLHRFAQHKNPDWATHASCEECGWGLPKDALYRNVFGWSLPQVRFNHLSDDLQNEFAEKNITATAKGMVR